MDMRPSFPRPFRLIVAGSDSFTGLELLKARLDALLAGKPRSQLQVHVPARDPRAQRKGPGYCSPALVVSLPFAAQAAFLRRFQA
jgi:hypothetical protein